MSNEGYKQWQESGNKNGSISQWMNYVSNQKGFRGTIKEY
jgi:hypothetical protein